MKSRPPLFLYTFLVLLAGCAFMAYWSGAIDIIPVFKEQARLWERVIWPLMRLTGFISIGLFIGLMVEGMGWTERLAVMSRPFMRWGHLSHQMGAVFTTAFFSGTASLSMLMSFYQEGSLNRREVTLAVLLNTFPSFFLHLPTTFFVILPLTGKAGAIYLCLTLAAALLRLITIVTCSHFVLPLSEAVYSEKIFENKNWKGMALEAGKKLKSRLGRMLMIILPVYLIIVLVSDMGFFLWLRKSLVLGISSAFIPVEAMSVVIFSLVAEFTSGHAAAGAMLDAGTLDTFQTVLALLLGNIIAAPVRALRHQVPYYMGIFSPGLGAYLMLISQAFRLVSLMAVGLIFILGVNILG